MYKHIVEGKKAIFFDLDGTIVETRRYINQAIEKVLSEQGISTINPDEYYILGESCEKQWKLLIALNSLTLKKNIQELKDTTHKYYIDIIDKSDLQAKEGFWDFTYELKEEKGLKLALTTNSTRETTDTVLKKIGATNLFDFTICGNEVKKTKPSPEMYKRVAKKLKIKTKEVTVFEDSLPGAKAANKAGMDLVIIWDGTTPKHEFPGNIFNFLHSFYGLAGNLDLTYVEGLRKAHAEYQEIKSP